MLKFEPVHDYLNSPAPPDTMYEIVDGNYVEKPMSARSQVDGSKLHFLLGSYADENRLGRFVMETIFAFPGAENWRRPDLAFVSYERWPERKRIPIPDGWQVVPEIAVEVLSPSNSVFELETKMQEYFTAGVREVWVVSPFSERLQIYTSMNQDRILARNDTLTSELLPGLALPLSKIFLEYDDEPPES